MTVEKSTQESRLQDVRVRYEALSGRYLLMPLGQLHIDIGECLSQIDELQTKLMEKNSE
jgi:hypothetical protein